MFIQDVHSSQTSRPFLSTRTRPSPHHHTLKITLAMICYGLQELTPLTIHSVDTISLLIIASMFSNTLDFIQYSSYRNISNILNIRFSSVTESLFLSSYWRQDLSTHHSMQLGCRNQHGVESHKYWQRHSSRRAAYESYSQLSCLKLRVFNRFKAYIGKGLIKRVFDDAFKLSHDGLKEF